MSSTAASERPGSDPSRPHQDLRIPGRIPSRLLGQAVPSSLQQSGYSTPPVAVQIASLHRAAEVARFQWRANHAGGQAHILPASSERSATSTGRPSPRLEVSMSTSSTRTPRSAFSSSSSPTSGSIQSNRDGQRSSIPRLYSSSLEAYISAAQEILPASQASRAQQSDIELGLDSESDDTEEDVIESTLRTSYERRTGSDRVSQSPDNASALNVYAEDVAAESQVWDRMLDDLAIGAGIHSRLAQSGYSPYSRGISGGIAASMLALSAAVPRPGLNAADSQRQGQSVAPPRLLPHPIWARRYPGAAGEWLRGELARRAQASMREQNNESRELRSGTQRSAGSREHGSESSSSSSPWRSLQFPSLDPSTRERPTRQVQASEIVPATIPSDTTSSNTLSVPSNATALAPTPPPEAATVEQERWTSLSIAPEARVRASQIVARMAAQLRERNAAHITSPAAPSEISNQEQSRALRGGMDYIRRLRAIDAAEERRRREERANFTSDGSAYSDQSSEPSSPPQPHEVFPWYHPPAHEDALADRMAGITLSSQPIQHRSQGFDPNGTHLAHRIHATALSAQWDSNNDPNGELFESDDDNDDPLLRRRLYRASAGTTSAAQRHRNRSALVIASDDAWEGTMDQLPGNAADGWTVINARPSSPVRETRDEGSQNVTTWFRGPAFSSSPVPMDDEERNSNRVQASAPLRRRSASTLDPLLPHSRTAATVPRAPTAPVRRAEYSSSPSRGTTEAFGIRSIRRNARESTPSPEPRRHSGGAEQGTDTSLSDVNAVSDAINRTRHLSNVGALLEEEFRSRQSELQQREDRLRSEVARRRLELDELRRQQGRIGRVLERSRMEQSEDLGAYELAWDMSTEPHQTESDANGASDESASHLRRQPSTGSASLVRRGAVRESLLRAPRRVTDNDGDYDFTGIR